MTQPTISNNNTPPMLVQVRTLRACTAERRRAESLKTLNFILTRRTLIDATEWRHSVASIVTLSVPTLASGASHVLRSRKFCYYYYVYLWIDDIARSDGVLLRSYKLFHSSFYIRRVLLRAHLHMNSIVVSCKSI